MKSLTKNEILPDLFSGKKFRSMDWEEERYIEVSNGQIVTNDGEPFDVMGADDEEWVLWVKPIKTGIVTKEEALKALYEGKKVKAKNWQDEVIFVKDGQIMINGTKPFNIMTADEKEWLIVEDAEAKTSEHEEIAELKAMVAELLKNSEKEKTVDGRNLEVQNETKNILKEVYGVSTPKEIEKQFKDALNGAKSSRDIEVAVCQYIPFCWINRTVNTTVAYYTNMRNIIKDIENEAHRDLGLALFLPPQGFYERAHDVVVANKKEALREKNTFSPKYINELLAKIKAKIVSDDFSDKPRQTDEQREKAYWSYAYLTIATGRRQVEILKTVSIVKNKREFFYDGISKKNEGDVTKIKAFALDDDFEFLTKLLNFIQTHIDSKNSTEKEINQKWNNSFNNALKRITGTSFTAKEWRDIYAEMMWYSNDAKTKSNIDKRDYKAQILGHESDGKLSPTEHYDVWEAVEDEE